MTNPLRDPRDRRLPRVPEPCALVVFGVTGDLARKKLIPAVYDLANRGLLPPGFVLLGFLAVAGFYLLTQHTAHVFGVLPYLLILACPLMHLFHRHGGHGSQSARGTGDNFTASRRTDATAAPARHHA